MDQTFSIKNLKKLMKHDREKGGALEENFIPQADVIRKKINELKKLRSVSRKKLRIKKITEEFFAIRSGRISAVLEKRKAQHDGAMTSALELVAAEMNKKDFKVDIVQLPSLVAGKKVYGVGNSLSQILAVRFTQNVLKVIYDVKMPPRDMLVSQVKKLALDGMPKFIVRADVESFYESVRHKDLLDGIHQSPELSVVIKRILTRLIKNYESLTGEAKGLPRGVGISAYLSEIYLSSIDAQIKRHEDLFYYSRYVDDMILMYAPQRKDSAGGYLKVLEDTLMTKGLRVNSKTEAINLLESQVGKFEYLGYEFDMSPSKKGVRLSLKKFNKYKDRIDKSFADYIKKEKFVAKKAAEELYVRALYLTGNMRLFNRKSNAFIGVYFSNKFITDTKQLKGLDAMYQAKVRGISDPALARRLAKLSFVEGFEKKIFRGFDAVKLSLIARGWTHA
ncbi:antiviral reverse transcriptase Drt3a [Pseudomonas sp. Pseu.R1]|uniref:antiviral reverse transcriptase Drt3a n=1 Tax=Pseudomonas sp. Pseu.R1 TaxID=3379818 RepID=UPI003B94973C